ncbi:MAG: Hsp20/alpha crystallin family protein [Desulfomonile sp.]|nr:Hsp20/alpha crystallin family protein [Desulfomonile sp.]
MFGSLVPWRRRESHITPGSALTEFRKEMDDLFNSFFGEIAPPMERFFGAGFAPDFDISESDKEVIVKGDLPGVNPSDVEISLTGNTLTIRGEKKEEKEERGENVYRMERRYGGFSRVFTLPCDVQEDKVEAGYKNGVLTVKLPKTESSMRKTIRIDVH